MMWNSYHFFIFDFAQMNHCLREAVAPLSEELADELFFIRYWHGGPHIRLRIRDGVNERPLIDNIAQYWQSHGSPITLEATSYYEPYRAQFAAEGEDAKDILYSAGDIVPIRYMPEVSRYGGESALPLCEAFFCKDTRRLLQSLHTAPAQNEKLMLVYCLTVAAALDQAGYEGARLFNIAAYSQSSSTQWLCDRVSERFNQQRSSCYALFRHVCDGKLFPAQCQALHKDITALIQGLESLQGADTLLILHSVLHMSFNRAGVAPFKEKNLRYFAYLILTEFGESHERKAG